MTRRYFLRSHYPHEKFRGKLGSVGLATVPATAATCRTCRHDRTANGHELLLRQEVYDVASSALEILNLRGHSLNEKVVGNCRLNNEPSRPIQMKHKVDKRHKRMAELVAQIDRPQISKLPKVQGAGCR